MSALCLKRAVWTTSPIIGQFHYYAMFLKLLKHYFISSFMIVSEARLHCINVVSGTEDQPQLILFALVNMHLKFPTVY